MTDACESRAASSRYPFPDYTLLNLAAAVQVITYECRIAVLGPPPPAAPAAELAAHEEVENFFEHLDS